MRTLDYLAISLKDLKRQPVRTFLTLMALVISSSLFLALTSLGFETRNALIKQLGSDETVSTIIVSSSKSLGSGFFDSNVQVANEQTSKLDDTTLQTLSGLPHVRSATPLMTVWEFRSFNVDGSEKKFVAKTQAIDPLHSSGLVSVAAGSNFTAGSAEPQVIVGNAYLKAIGKSSNPKDIVGKQITITTQNGYRGEGANIPSFSASKAEQEAFANSPTTLSATIVGVTKPSVSDNIIYIPLEWARKIQSPQRWSGREIVRDDLIAKNGYSSILIQADKSGSVKSLSTQIESMGYGVSSRQKQIDQINQLSLVMWFILGSMALISLVSAALGIVNTMLMTVSEQRSAIGVWRACGATRSHIVKMFLYQSAILGIVGGAIGTAIGYFASNYVNQKIAIILKSQGLESIAIQSASWRLLIGTVILTALLAIIAGIYPAFRAAKRIEV